MTAAVTAPDGRRGRNVISSRALRRVVSAVTADQLDVAASDVSIELADDRGDLAVTARTPIRTAPLAVGSAASASASASASRRNGAGTMLGRLAQAQTTIQNRCLTLTGTTISRVDLHVTRVDLGTRSTGRDERRRVT